jgi:predicted AAA+ superfamily ATPase
VLGAVKRSVDVDPSPGRFLVTGSVRAHFDPELWPGTGRLVRVAMYGLTVRERLGRASAGTFYDRLLAGEEVATPRDAPDLVDYVEQALRGAFPEVALHLAGAAGQAWLESYVEQLLTRDARQVDVGRDEARLRRYFEAYALNSAGVVADRTLYEAAGINRRTALAYEQLLESLLVVQAIPAWASNRLKRLVLSPKRYLVDPALAAGTLGLDARAVLRDGDLLGRILDTFVVAQLRGELSASLTRTRLFHLRQEQGRHEIDVLAELGGDRVVAVEVKATAAPRKDDARHLVWLRDRLEDRFAAGVVFHTGPRAYLLDDRIGALPICALWSGEP